MGSSRDNEWAIIVFGENNKGKITYDMMRSFSDVFRKHGSAYGLRLAKFPSFVFTKNVHVAYAEVEEILEELISDEDIVLVLLINDSDMNDVVEVLQTSLGKRVVIYGQKSSSFFLCAHESTEEMLISWIKELCGLLGERSADVAVHTKCSCSPSASNSKSANCEPVVTESGSKQIKEDLNRTTKRETVSGVDLLDFIHVENALADLEKSHMLLKDIDLVKYIDGPILHNRLRSPYTDREQNGHLLRLLSAASSTELPDLQSTVVNFVEKILKSDFIPYVLNENAHFMNSAADGKCCSIIFIYLQNIMQLLYIAKINHIPNYDCVYNNLSDFMGQIPEQCWLTIDEELQLTIFRMLKELTVNASSEVKLNESWEESSERSGTVNELKIDRRASDVFVEDFQLEGYKPAWIDCDCAEPPEDFRTLPVYITSKDIIQPVRPYVRRNIVEGSYLSQEHYLDIQFRLMREDFIAPMRDGITLWKKHKGEGAFLSHAVDITEELDLLVLSNVVVEGAQLKRSTGEIIRYAIFQPFGADSLWSQRLKYGQMVALSSDGFKNEALLATVAEKDADGFINGRLGLCFFDDRAVSRAKAYTLVESDSYYEMYQHVLESLKLFDDNHVIPFGRYLLKAEADVPVPAYLSQRMEHDCASSGSSSTEYTDDSGSPPREKAVVTKEISIFGKRYPVDRLKYTLDGEKVAGGLDDAQRNALCHALTRELALIQGPPGTGKTFLGRLIVRILFENMNMWNPARLNPILVVCFTNHALDQFLEGILLDLVEDGRFNDDLPSIVRIGTRCKSEVLKKYMKRQVIESYDNLIPVMMKQKANQVLSKRAQLVDEIRTMAAVLAFRKREILSFKFLRKAMLPEHVRQIERMRRSGGRCQEDEALGRWLVEGEVVREVSASEASADCEEEEEPKVPVMWSMKETMPAEEKNEQSVQDGVEPERDVQTSVVEQLRRANPDIDDYYHAGEWDLEKDRNASAIKPVTIFPDRNCSDLRERVKYDIEVVASLEGVRNDILKSSPLSDEEAASIKALNTLHRDRRWALYMYWISKLRTVASKTLDTLIKKYQTHMVEVKKENDLIDEIVLRKALVIGATTTGAAKVRPFLNRLGCRVVIVEEAAEVLEAHVLTSITEGCQHAILIGDHQQLRPNPSVFALAREYNLEISLFERLIKNHFTYAALEKQHRMASIISNTLMPEFYPLMVDASNIFNYPDVKGCRKNLYFINHQHQEDALFSTSHKNSFEGDFAVNLAAYFVQQGYSYEQITLLCTYTAQTSYVKTLAMSKFSYESSPLVDTVDNYQGEENDIIILSLVRSQPSDGIGFLAIPNRVCVALSRAKHGLYIIGNMHFLKSNSRLWDRLYASLVDVDCIGDGFPAFCEKHDVTQMICSAKDFLTKTPEGGCHIPCDFVRQCGHVCGKPCHRKDPEHKSICTHTCAKTCQTVYRHPCTRQCGEPCRKCETFEIKTFPCGHESGVVCHLFEKAACRQKCPKKLACGHQCVKRCNERCKCSNMIQLALDCGHTVTAACSEERAQINCTVQVEKTFVTCGHRTTVQCHEYKDAPCNMQCEKLLPCGHRCQSLCGNCSLTGCYGCVSFCGKRLPCGHECLRRCGEVCEPCIAPCSNQCGHAHCGQEPGVPEERKPKCGDLCNFCVQHCMNGCKHRACPLQCWQVCKIPPCTFPCDKKNKCGHPCGGLCGEVCPGICTECSRLQSPVLQFQGCRCIVSVQDADLHILAQTVRNERYTCPKCARKLTVNSCLRYAKQLKGEAILFEKSKFAKLLNGGLLISAQHDVLKQATDDLARMRKTQGRKNGLLPALVAESLQHVITRLSTEFYNHAGVTKWAAVVNMLSDICKLTEYISIEKFNSIPKKRYSNLHSLFSICLGTTNNILPKLETGLIELLAVANLLKTESPSVLEASLASGLRKICIKYMLGKLANDFIKRSTDLELWQLDDLQKVVTEALCWLGDSEQKKSSIRFVKICREFYESMNMQHMLVNDLQCMNFAY